MSAVATIARVAELQAMLGLAPVTGTGGTAAPAEFATVLAKETSPRTAGEAPATLAPGPVAGGLAGETPISGVPFASEITAAAQRHGLDPALLAGLIKQESGFNPAARSPAGAQGLTQLMPATAAGLGVTNPLDPAQAIEGGAKYLAQQLRAFGGDVARALAAYNAGPGAVQRFGGVPPYAETQNYVRTVQANAAAFRAGTSVPSIT
jgi:soluble lytic murein transglycosylase-like protein